MANGCLNCLVYRLHVISIVGKLRCHAIIVSSNLIRPSVRRPVPPIPLVFASFLFPARHCSRSHRLLPRHFEHARHAPPWRRPDLHMAYRAQRYDDPLCPHRRCRQHSAVLQVAETLSKVTPQQKKAGRSRHDGVLVWHTPAWPATQASHSSLGTSAWPATQASPSLDTSAWPATLASHSSLDTSAWPATPASHSSLDTSCFSSLDFELYISPRTLS